MEEKARVGAGAGRARVPVGGILSLVGGLASVIVVFLPWQSVDFSEFLGSDFSINVRGIEKLVGVVLLLLGISAVVLGILGIALRTMIALQAIGIATLAVGAVALLMGVIGVASSLEASAFGAFLAPFGGVVIGVGGMVTLSERARVPHAAASPFVSTPPPPPPPPE
jgi:hypothetical protein